MTEKKKTQKRQKGEGTEKMAQKWMQEKKRRQKEKVT